MLILYMSRGSMFDKPISTMQQTGLHPSVCTEAGSGDQGWLLGDALCWKVGSCLGVQWESTYLPQLLLHSLLWWRQFPQKGAGMGSLLPGSSPSKKPSFVGVRPRFPLGKTRRDLACVTGMAKDLELRWRTKLLYSVNTLLIHSSVFLPITSF